MSYPVVLWNAELGASLWVAFALVALSSVTTVTALSLRRTVPVSAARYLHVGAY